MSFIAAPLRFAGDVVKSAGRFVSELGNGKHSPPSSTDPICLREKSDYQTEYNYHSLEESTVRHQELIVEAEALKSKQSRESQTEIESRLQGGKNALESRYYQVAITEFERVLTLSPGHVEAQEAIKKCYRYLGDEWFGKQSYFPALDAYVKAGFDQGVQDVMEVFGSRAEALEQEADAKGSSLNEVESALKGYAGIHETFLKIEKKLFGKYPIEKFSLQREAIQKKIEQTKRKIHALEAKDLVQKADQMVDDLEKIFKEGGHTKAALEGFRKHLDDIDLIYIQARHKDRSCLTPRWAQLSELLKEIHGKIAQCRREEVLHSMNECFACLEKSSLKEERSLDSIINHSERWLDYFSEAIRFPGVDKEQMKKIKEIVEQGNRLATVSRAYIKNPWTFLYPIVNQVIHDCNESGELIESHRKILEECFNEMFENNRELRKAFISLSPSGCKQLKMKMQDHLKTRIVRDSCLGCLPRSGNKYSFKPRMPIREADMFQWLKEMRPEHLLKDIGDEFQAGALREESYTERGGEIEGLPEISLYQVSLLETDVND